MHRLMQHHWMLHICMGFSPLMVARVCRKLMFQSSVFFLEDASRTAVRQGDASPPSGSFFEGCLSFVGWFLGEAQTKNATFSLKKVCFSLTMPKGLNVVVFLHHGGFGRTCYLKKRNQLHKNVLGNHGCFACILEIYTIAKFEAIDGFTLMIFSNDLLASLVTINSKHLFT